jgi:hypothetical protein
MSQFWFGIQSPCTLEFWVALSLLPSHPGEDGVDEKEILRGITSDVVPASDEKKGGCFSSL